MKTQALVSCIFASLLLLGACQSSPLDKRATGLAYEVVVNMTPDEWNGEAGKAVKADLMSDVPGLPSSEPSMRVTYAAPKDFNGLLTWVKNILIVKINASFYTKVTLTYEKDRWANGQTVITMTAPDQASVAEFMNDNPRIIANYFTRIEMDRAAALFEKTYSQLVMDSVKKKFDISIKAPETITTVGNSSPNFFWASNNAPTGRTDMVVYTFPYTDPNTFTLDYLVAKRDSVMKINLPGAYPDSYMATETRFDVVDYTPITLNGKYCGVMRGLWRVQGDMMGGPFVSHTVLDEANNRVVVAEVFVYSPESDKRNYIRRAEASLYTLRLPGDMPASAPAAQQQN